LLLGVVSIVDWEIFLTNSVKCDNVLLYIIKQEVKYD
jgi:hypothetical protein